MPFPWLLQLWFNAHLLFHPIHSNHETLPNSERLTKMTTTVERKKTTGSTFMLHEIGPHIDFQTWEVCEAIEATGIRGRLTPYKVRVWNETEVNRLKAHLESRS